MRGKAWGPAIVAGGAVAAFQLAYYIITSGPGCAMMPDPGSPCSNNLVVFAGVGVPLMLTAMTWGFRELGLEAALLGTIVTAGCVYVVLGLLAEPGWGPDDPVAIAMLATAFGVAFAFTSLASRLRIGR
jgi:hypothetical protein